MNISHLVGITGTNGAGKDTVAKFLFSKGYSHISLSDALRAIADERGLEHSRRNLSSLSEEIRTKEGNGAMAKRALVGHEAGVRLCLTSIRMPEEARAIKEAGGTILWVDADPELRYQRIAGGERSRGQTDQVSFGEFLRQEAVEMTPTEEGGGLNILAIKDMADYVVENNFATIADFEADLSASIKLS